MEGENTPLKEVDSVESFVQIACQVYSQIVKEEIQLQLDQLNFPSQILEEMLANSCPIRY